MTTYGVLANNGFDDRGKVERTIRELRVANGDYFRIVYPGERNPVYDTIHEMMFINTEMTVTESRTVDHADKIIIFTRQNLSLFRDIIRYAETMDKPIHIVYQFHPDENASYRHILKKGVPE